MKAEDIVLKKCNDVQNLPFSVVSIYASGSRPSVSSAIVGLIWSPPV